MRIKAALAFIVFLAIFTFPMVAVAQELVQDKYEKLKARVVEVVNEGVEFIPGTEVEHDIQTLRAEILEGESKGQIIQLVNDLVMLDKGNKFYLSRVTHWDSNIIQYGVADPYRGTALWLLTIMFIIATVVFGGKQGLRGLLSLAGSFAVIAFVLIPGILAGHSPVLVAVGVSSLIIVLGSYVTHGFNKTTTAAVVGMIATVSLVGLLAKLSIGWASLTGFGADEAVYLNFSSGGTIDLAGLLLGGILIGLLGVMYDAAIGQAVSVEELHRVAPHLPRRTIYARAVRIGREHIGALVNTLAIAYVGASLPLLLMFSYTSESAGLILNREIFATEIVRTMVGSIGLILTVPATTMIAVLMLVKPKRADEETIEAEKRALEHASAHHGHSHG